MDDETMSKVIAHYMPDACAGKSCPAPEIWAAVINEDLPASECARFEEHAQGCPYCTAERKLAQEFVDMPQAADGDEVAWIVGRAAAADEQQLTNVVQLRPRRRRILPSLIGLAAAAMLVLAFAPMLPLMQPALDVPVVDDVTRGTRISALQPAGELAVAPSQLQWSAAEAAVRYRVTIRDVAGQVVWTAYSDDPTTVTIPAGVREQLHDAVVYNWTVEGLNEAGQTTAQSPETSFRVKP